MTGGGKVEGWTRRVLARLRHFVNMLIPSLEDIRVHTPIVPPLVVGWVFSLAAAFSLRPLLQSLMGDQGPEITRTMMFMVWLLALIAPVVQLLKAGLLTVLGWAMLVLTNSERRIRPILSVLLYGEAILAAQGVLLALYLHLTTGGTVASPADLQVSLGLAAFVPATSPFLFAIAQVFSIGHFCWFAFLVMALRRCDGPEVRPSLGLALFFWGVMMAFSAARAWVTL